MSDNMQGWELLLRIVRTNIKKKEDILFLLIHFSLLKSDFKCAGKTENWSTDESLSECLPDEWNSDDEYILRYKRKNEKYILKSSHIDENAIIFNLTIIGKLKVTNVIFNFEEAVDTVEGDIASMVPTYSNLLKQISENLISPFISNENNQSKTKTDEKFLIESINLRESEKKLQNLEYIDSLRYIGQRDLDPLAAMGSGGMLFDPFSQHKRILNPRAPILPRGSVPPQARFDPFGPPDNDIPNSRRGFPYPPPDYNDMFS